MAERQEKFVCPALLLVAACCVGSADDDVREVSTAKLTAIAILLLATATVWIPARVAEAIDPAVTLHRQ